ncbi:response regulator [Sphingomonas xinjiangensis]|uniref:DNA-binding NarL/FixJ family response regulator n=1 Tax=Sphingomonas xinjiangensis TaxID=643568 RepID=A0A840YQR2_9SPHN|nr:response regulator [Sphingomonas xinjiangensis]MBB5711461.1 DNA-binding NarL/FixJ family response regulator [Sphingomonas xinjiangensis]
MTAAVRLAQRRVLVVEDEPLVALELISILEEAGAEIIGPAFTAGAAIEIIPTVKPDAVLLDGNLQGSRVEMVAEAFTLYELPSVVVTVYGREHLPTAFRHIPVIEKPFDRGQLVATIMNRLPAQKR